MTLQTRHCFLALLLLVSGLGAQNAVVPIGLCVSTGASGTAYTCSPAPVIEPLYSKNQTWNWTPDVTNTTTTPTINLGAGVVTLTSVTGGPLFIGSLIPNTPYIISYETTNIRIISPTPEDPTIPTTSSCGTGPTVDGTDRSGIITVGTGTSACTLIFHIPLATPARCVMGSATARPITFTTSTTGFVINDSPSLAGSKVNYVCR